MEDAAAAQDAGPLLPGLDVALRTGPAAGAPASVAQVDRLGANHWELCMATDAAARVQLRLELDVCGAWCTLASEGRRPVVVRRAGWVDLRGQPPGSVQPWDRVGLGPGDGVAAVSGTAVPEDALMDLLLPLTGRPATDVAATVLARLPEATAAVAVVRVPELAKEQSLERAVEATGLPPAHFAEPLHPVGSPAAELWDSRPAPPREARMRLPPERAAVPAARSLLRRLLASWRMEELLDGHIELLASEVLTNGVLHARTELMAVLSFDGRSVRFAVHDGSPVIPRLHVPELEDEGGRGLWMVSALADRWAVEATPHGKRVWFDVAA